MHRLQRIPGLLLALAVAAIAIRLALPFIVKDYVNGRLHSMRSYDGSVADTDIRLWRGAYRIDRIEIVKTRAAQPVPFFAAKRVDLSLEWRSLLRGSLVARARFYEPRLSLVEATNESRSQLGRGEHWHDRLEELFPFRFNTVEVLDGTITFRAPGIAVGDALTAEHVNGVITNITNVERSGKQAFAKFRLDGEALGGARIWACGTAEPLAEPPTFDLNYAMEHVDVPRMNPWLREYLGAGAKRGDFALYVEVASANGRYKGYAKPILRDVEFITLTDPTAPAKPLKSLWKGVLQFAAEVFENRSKDQVAAKIPFSGAIGNEHTDLIATIASVLRNAYVSAFTHSFEGTISIEEVEKSPEGG